MQLRVGTNRPKVEELELVLTQSGPNTVDVVDQKGRILLRIYGHGGISAPLVRYGSLKDLALVQGVSAVRCWWATSDNG